jgi:hypothetical protein
MYSNILTEKISIQEGTATDGILGRTIIWKPIGEFYGRIIPIDAKAQIAYQQLNKVITHKILLRGKVTITLGKHRFLSNYVEYDPIEPVQMVNGDSSILVREIA